MKRIVVLLLLLIMAMSLPGCSSKPAKMKVTGYSLDMVDGAVFQWEKVKNADCNKIYRGELGEATADEEVEWIEASESKATHYLSKRVAGNFIDTATGMLSEDNSIAIVHMFKEGIDYDRMRLAMWPEGVSTARSMSGPVYSSANCEILYTIAVITP